MPQLLRVVTALSGVRFQFSLCVLTLAIMTGTDAYYHIVVGDESTYIAFCRALRQLELSCYLQKLFSGELTREGVQEGELLWCHGLARGAERCLVVWQQSFVNEDGVVDETRGNGDCRLEVVLRAD